MRALAIAALVLTACGSDPEPSSSTSSGGGASSGASSSSASSGASTGGSSGGGSSSGSSSGATGGACKPVTLAAPGPGEVALEATFTDPQAGYNGSTEPFTADPAAGSVYASPMNPYLWTALTKPQGMGDDGLRGIVIGIPVGVPLCTPHTTTSPPGSPPYFRYFEGSNTARQWACVGTVVLDTLEGKSQTFHFDVTCEPFNVTNAGTGTVKVSGTGAATSK